MPSKETIELMRKEYKKGTRVKLISMDDPYYKIPEGTLGTVMYVDDLGDIGVNWDNGSSLKVVYGVDFVKIV